MKQRFIKLGYSFAMDKDTIELECVKAAKKFRDQEFSRTDRNPLSAYLQFAACVSDNYQGLSSVQANVATPGPVAAIEPTSSTLMMPVANTSARFT